MDTETSHFAALQDFEISVHQTGKPDTHLDFDDVGVVVELDEPLVALSREPLVDLGECLLLHPLDGVSDVRVVHHGGLEDVEGVVPDILGKVRLDLCEKTTES